MMFRFPIQILLSLLASAGLFCLAGCSGGSGSQAVDTFLKDRESQVVKWEAKVKTGGLALTDLEHLRNEGQANLAKIQELAKMHKFSKSQAEHGKALEMRMQKLISENVRSAMPARPR